MLTIKKIKERKNKERLNKTKKFLARTALNRIRYGKLNPANEIDYQSYGFFSVLEHFIVTVLMHLSLSLYLSLNTSEINVNLSKPILEYSFV